MDLKNLSNETLEELKKLTSRVAKEKAKEGISEFLKYIDSVPAFGGMAGAAVRGALSHLNADVAVETIATFLFDVIEDWLRQASGVDYGLGVYADSVSWEDNR
jgi:hypothetical protein